MDRLLEYIQLHPFLASLAVAMAFAVLIFELRSRGQNYSAVQPQEAIRLMNQGAQVYDLRNKDAFVAGHVSGAKHLDPGQVEGAGETLKLHIMRQKKRQELTVEVPTTATPSRRGPVTAVPPAPPMPPAPPAADDQA